MVPNGLNPLPAIEKPAPIPEHFPRDATLVAPAMLLNCVSRLGTSCFRRVSVGSFRALLAAALLGFAVGCGKRLTSVEAGIRTRTLHVGNGVEPQGLDPQTTTGANEYWVQIAVFESLLGFDPVTGDVAPGVASAWDVSADLLTYTFHLRPDARWSNGRPIVADDFVRTAQRALSPVLGAEVANDFLRLAGARAYFEGKERDFSRVGIRALDARTVQYTLSDPLPGFLPIIATRMGIPLPIDSVIQHGGMEKRGAPWTRPGNLIGNGPFVLKTWTPNKEIVVEKSPTYWDRDRVKLDRIVFHPVENAETEEKMFRAGQLHKTFNLPVTKIAAWRRDNPTCLRIEPVQRNLFLVVNVTRPPFTDARIRRALALALDRDQLVGALGAGQRAAHSFAPPNGTDFESLPQYKDDVSAARSLLAEAGFPDGKGFRPFAILLPNRGNARLMMEIVQEMWRKNLGIAATFNQQDWGVYIDSENNGQYDVAQDGWSTPHPHLFFDLNRTGNPMSRYLWSNADYDAALREAARAPTAAARNAVYARMEALLAREMPVIPLHFEVSTFLLHPSVRGWHANLLNNHPWKYLSLESKN